MEIKIRVAVALARSVGEGLSVDHIMPDILDKHISKMIADEIGQHLAKL